MYAIFSCRKLSVTSSLNSAQESLMRLDDQQFKIATGETSVNLALSTEQQIYATKIADKYGELTKEGLTDDQRTTIKDEISQLEKEQEAKVAELNAKMYTLSQQENAIELQKKRMETRITKLSKELETIEQAEKDGIDRANPKYSGLG